MCGIAGILNFNQQQVSPQILRSMGNAIAHRGPDDSGIWSNDSVGFAHQRLSIIDTSAAGSQPMHSDDKRFTIVYNGELYNHNDFRNELAQKGFTFRSKSDTEVLLYLFICYGPAMLKRLNGMFAFAIWDQLKEELFICRDRIGVKPFYYHINKDQFSFASEPKAIFASGIQAKLNQANINEWLYYRHVAGNQTLLQGIQKLLPGHYAFVKPDGSFQQTRWWKLSEQIQNHPKIDHPYNWFEETFHDAVKSRMIADVPVGVMLSGGIDSSSIAASLKHSNFEHIHTFNVGFSDYKYDESFIAKRYSESLSFPFHGITVEKTNLFQAVVKSTVSYDEPLVHLNDPQILSLASAAKKHVKVLLSGEGADEFLGGYVRYKVFRYLKHPNVLNTLLSITPDRFKNTRIKKLERYIANGTINELIKSNGANYFETDFNDLKLPYLNITNTYRDEITREASQLYPKDASRQLLYYDQHTYLQSLNDRNDRATMGASLECRDPFMDYRLMEGLGTLSTKHLLKGRKGKYILMQTMKKHLPDYILNHQKVGFSVPWEMLIKQSEELSFEYQEYINSDIFEWIGLSRESVQNLFAKNNTQRFYQLQLQLFFFYIWRKYYLFEYTHQPANAV
jgi:asparagine synthase (glutamine-hydrolysing)